MNPIARTSALDCSSRGFIMRGLRGIRVRAAFGLLAAILVALTAACGSSGSTERQVGGSGGSSRQVVQASPSSEAYVGPGDAAGNLTEVLGNGSQPNTQLPSSGQSLPDFMSAVAADVAGDWAQRFQNSGYVWQPAYYYWVPGQQLVAAGAGGDCNYAGDPDYFPDRTDVVQAFACKSDLTVYMSIDWVDQNLWQPHIDPQTGDVDPGGTMAVGVAIAHEYFHIAQDQLGIAPPADATDVSSIELQADCGAGVWANDKYKSGQLQDGDIQVAEQTLSGLGDYEFGSGHHGTPAQRDEAFMLGYNTGDVSQCTLDLGNTLAA
jgi:predicted metalloprotease